MKTIRTITTSILAVGLLAGSAVGAAAQSAGVTGTLDQLEACEQVAPFTARCWGGSADFDDSRLTGDYELTETVIEDNEGDGFSDAFIAAVEVKVTNADGSWSGHFVDGGYLIEDAEEVRVGGGAWVLLGEGGYEGLAAVLRPDETTDEMAFFGVILENETQ